MSRCIDLTGQRFGRLIAIKKVKSKNGQTNARWLCKCDCGNYATVLSLLLRDGTTKSCGCYRREATSERRTTFGISKSAVAHTWYGMRQRCNNPKNNGYKNYGGRGISVCEEWQNDFGAFYEYVSALPHFGEPGRSLDRINNDGNYEPGNVRWATHKEQSNNRRKRRWHRKPKEEV